MTAGSAAKLVAAERKSNRAQPAECAERHGIVGDAGRLGRLHDDIVDPDVGAVGAGPRRGDHLLAALAQLDPQRLGARIGRGAERIDPIAADRRGKSAGAGGDRRGDIVERVGRNIVVNGRGTGGDGDVRDGGERRRGGHILTRDNPLVQLGEAAVPRQYAGPGTSG